MILLRGTAVHAETKERVSDVNVLGVTGDFWEEDPGCYLTNEEIGVVDDLPRRVAAQAIEIPVHNL